METPDAVGFLQDRAWILAALELSGAVGLFVGLFWQPLAIAAGIGIVLYFVGAVGSYLRAHDPNFTPALVILDAAAVSVTLNVLSM